MNKTKIPFLPLTFSSLAQYHSWFSFISSLRASALSAAQESGGCVRSVMVPLCLSFLLTLFPCSSMESLPLDSVLHKLLQHGFFLYSSLRIALEFIFSMVCASGTNFSSICLPQTTLLVSAPVQSSIGCSVEVCPDTGCSGKMCFTMVLWGFTGNVCIGTWDTSSPSLFSD